MAAAPTTPLLAAALLLLLLHGASAAGFLNVTQILERGQQYTTFIRLLGSTQSGNQVQNQLNNTHDGVTVFAPTDNAFASLKAGALNGLSAQHQSELILFHVLPQFYTLETFQTASNPVRTMAGEFTLNVTSAANQQVNVSTSVVNVPVRNALNVTSPVLAVYSIDTVLLPDELFGDKKAKAPVSAPAPAGSTTKGSAGGSTNGTAEVAAPQKDGAAGMGGAGLRWVVAVGLMSFGLMGL